MSKIEDGGPAFPRVGHEWKKRIPNEAVYPTNYEAPLPGMSLRDWFAGQVMDHMITLSLDSDGGWSPENVANGCYNLADAMLAARKTGGL
jgi:hypothetical protein